MSISELLLTEFDAEMKTTRLTLERVPFDKTGFAPHAKSMKLEKLAPHVAELPNFGRTILTTPSLDFGTGPSRERPPFEQAGLLKFFDEGAEKTRAALKSLPDSAWTETWKLSFQDKPIFSGERFPSLPPDVPESSGASSGAAWSLPAIERQTASGNVWSERGRHDGVLGKLYGAAKSRASSKPHKNSPVIVQRLQSQESRRITQLSLNSQQLVVLRNAVGA
jgi:hypothetical protein